MSSLLKTSEKTVKNMMESERKSLTCAPGGENNRGMEIIGRMPIKGEGFTAKDIEGLGPYFNKLMGASFGNRKAFVLDLNALSINQYINKFISIDKNDWYSSSFISVAFLFTALVSSFFVYRRRLEYSY